MHKYIEHKLNNLIFQFDKTNKHSYMIIKVNFIKGRVQQGSRDNKTDIYTGHFDLNNIFIHMYVMKFKRDFIHHFMLCNQYHQYLTQMQHRDMYLNK